jgi:C4-dicarboxylate-specific signal transduction histidine kinase
MGLPGLEVTGYLASFSNMPEAGWSVQVLTPMHELTGESLGFALTVLLLMISVLSIALLLRLRINRSERWTWKTRFCCTRKPSEPCAQPGMS